MKRFAFAVAAVVAACILSVAAPAQAEIKVANLTGADFAPGQLKLPLTVHERSGVERKGVVVSSGVPFPPGFLPDISKLAVVTQNGEPVVCQATPMLLWHKPAYDDSVQWALVSFAADVPANGTATYYLTDSGAVGSGPVRASGEAPHGATTNGIKLTKTAKDLAIDTGAASFTVPLAGTALLSSASFGGKSVLGPAGLQGTITPGDWADRNLSSAAKQLAAHDPAGVTVEESGPARIVVAIKGGFTPGDKEHKFYSFTARLYFTAGSPEVRVIYTIANDKLDPELRNGNHFAYVWPIKDASLVADLSGGTTASTLAEGKLISSAAGEPLAVYQSTLDVYKVAAGGKDLASGTRHLGVMDVSSGAAGLTVARRYFREEWPASIAASAKELRLGLLPGEADDVFHLILGQRKSWDIRLTLHGAQAPDAKGLQAAFAEQDALLLFRADPNWMVRAAGATGSWTAGLALTKKSATTVGLRRDEDIKRTKIGGIDNLLGGWERFGVIHTWGDYGWHWNEGTAYNDWVIHANGTLFDESEIPTLWAADHCPTYYDHPNMPAYFGFLIGGDPGHSRLKVSTFPGAEKAKAPCGVPDTGHMGMWMWVEYYLITGDARCREAICGLGQMGRAYLWHWTHDDPKDGSASGAVYDVKEFYKHNPDAEPNFKLDRRYVGWPLYCLAQFYQFTGDPELLAEAKIIAGAFRNTARANPVGFLCRDCAGKDGNPKAEYSDNIVKGSDGCESQVRMSKLSASLVSSNFYSGIVVYGIREYYLASKDPDALDTLVGEADRFCQYTMIRDENKKPLGWSYEFGDYWGPYTLADSMKNGKSTGYMSSANELTSDAVARLYYLTGRADVMETVQAAITKNAINPRVWAIYMAAMHPKVDQAAAAAIKDLTAAPLGGGKVKLTWTAPAVPGTAKVAFYQVKWTPAAKLVERIQGWPDLTNPLPTTPDEWLARANAFNAQQRSFWAANNAPNQSAIPKPAVPGTKETMVVEGLPAGQAVNLAIKSWSDAQNISEMSNVVTVK